MSETKKFKTETKRLLDLMINSIYTNKEIFLRELISNASDAIDKYHYLSLTDDKVETKDNYEIKISVNKDAGVIEIEDNGIGMTYDEVLNNLGTIAKSGSLEFAEKMNEKDAKEVDIIGQFGVGFYSSFMVADTVKVVTKSPYSEKAYEFTSSGTETYKIDEVEKDEVGTKITLYLRKDSEDEKYSEFLETYRIESLVKKYSDYVRYPIKMFIPHVHNHEGECDCHDEDCNCHEHDHDKECDCKDHDKECDGTCECDCHKDEWKTLNSMLPIWKKNKNEVKEEELNEFYKQKYYDATDPLVSIFMNIEGNVTYNALLYIPSKAPYNLYSDKFEKGLQLYTKGVFIMDKCKELIPDYLRFVKGLVDSSDLSLNISREILQQNSVLKKIAQNVEKRLLNELSKLMQNDFDKYKTFFDNYGLNLKYGVYDYNATENKDLLKDLLLYQSLNNEQVISLKQYVENMKEDQEFIYYASGKTKAQALSTPQLDQIKKKGYDCLILTDDIDEFAINMMFGYKEKRFKNINQGELDLLSQEEKDEIKSLEDTNKDVLEKMKKILENKVKDVVLSKRLTTSPVCMTSGEDLSLKMEQVMAEIPNNSNIKADRILEINPHHKIFDTILNANDEMLENISVILYNQVLLIEGIEIDDPVDYTNRLCEVLNNSIK